MNVHLTAVAVAAAALDQFSFHQAIDQSHYAVMAQLHTLRQVTYSDTLLLDQALQRQQELVLARFDPCSGRSLLTDSEEAANTVAELGESLVLVGEKIGIQCIHRLLLTYHDSHAEMF